MWPAAVATAQQPFKSHTWLAAMHVIMTRDGGDFTRTSRLRPARFEHVVRKELTRRAKIRPCLRILRNLYAAMADPAGVVAHRLGAFRRIGWLIEDWDTARAKLAGTEARMVAVLDALQVTGLACSIKGLCPVGAAAILAETGDLRRFTSSRAVVKHAGLAPRQRMFGTFAGRARLSGAGRPHLRTAAWRAVWGAVWGAAKSNPVYAARYRHLTTRETNKLKPTQAQTVLAGAILRKLHAVITTGQAWDPDIATHGTRHKPTRTLTEVAA